MSKAKHQHCQAQAPVCSLLAGDEHSSANVKDGPAYEDGAKLLCEDFAEVVRRTPLVAIDFLIQSELQEILLGLRLNAPARGFWFVPGGRIYKNEDIESAITRIAHDELALDRHLYAPKFVGVFEHFYHDNFLGDAEFDTHYVVLAYHITVPRLHIALTPKTQHAFYRWNNVNDLVHMNDVHPYVKHYASHL